MIKYTHNIFIMKLFQLFIFLSLGVTVISNSLAQNPETEEPKTYLRIASILPITQQRLKIDQGERTIAGGIGSGFYVPYFEVSGGEPILIKTDEGTIIGSETLKKRKGAPAFYTLVIYGDGKAAPKFSLYDDNPPSPPPGADDKTAPPPQKRFRGYFGGYPFPYRVTAEGIGQWDIAASTPLLVDIPIAQGRNLPKTISVTYKTRYDYPSTIYYPLWYDTADSCSAFVFQRGPTRPRLLSAPDNIESLKSLQRTDSEN